MNVPAKPAARVWLLILSLAALGGCATTPGLKSISDQQRDWLLSGEALVGHRLPPPEESPDSIMALTPEMKDFADAAVHNAWSDQQRLHNLVAAIILPANLGLVYDTQASYTAQETFKHRHANCLSFTLLMVAMARYVGVEIRFNEVEIPPVWDMQNNDTLVLYKHVNAIIKFRSGLRKVLDVSMEEYDTSFQQHLISDNLAVAQYFNNRAMEFLRDKQYPDALRYLAKAIQMQPRVSYFWNNLGALYRRQGKMDAAEMAFRTGLELDPSDLVVISNAAQLYADLGQTELAARLNERAKRFRLKNPYYRYKLAQSEYLDHEYAAARDDLLEAIRLYPQEHRFHFLLGAVYEGLGDGEHARASMNKAMELSTDERQISRYRNKMERLLAGQS